MLDSATSVSETEKYQKLTPHEHILRRPDTYIGSTQPVTEYMWVFDTDTQRLVQRSTTYVPGLYKIFDEILVNAADNKQRCPTMSKMEITLDPATGVIGVLNDGDGIPVEMHDKEQCYIPELIFGHLLTGSNFDDKEAKTTGGRNGYGAKLANIFSTEFTIETVCRGQKFRQTYTDNMRQKTPAKVTKATTKKDYTKVTFTPDWAKFHLTGMDDDHVALFTKRAYDMAGVSDRSLSVKLNGTKIAVKDFRDYTSKYKSSVERTDPDTGNTIPEKIAYYNDGRWEIGIGQSDDQIFQHVSFVNAIATSKGGQHVEYIARQVADHLVAACTKKNKGFKLKAAQMKNYLKVFVNCLITNPTFDSQTKDSLTTRPKDFGSQCKLPLNTTAKCALARAIESTGLVRAALYWGNAKEMAALTKTGGKKQSKLLGISKLDDANHAGTAKSRECTLILTEGDSAKSLAVSGLGVIGRDKYGVFPLKGKLLNVRDATTAQVTKNEEIANLVKILGLKYGTKYTAETLQTLRYGHVMIMTDQDHDGSHIKGLVVNFIHKFWPELLALNAQFVQQFITPIVKCTQGARCETFYTLPEYEAWKVAHDGGRGWAIKYYKGLGTSTSKEAKEYFSMLDRSVVDMTHSGVACDAAIDLAFSKKKVAQRKDWLLAHTKDTHMDFDVDEVSYDDFVRKELILFSVADNLRSIPSAIDGFKPSQRKVQFSCFKRKDLQKSEIKVAQLAGYVSEHSAYHHGEMSLTGTIVGMAQDYCGSNNINLLMPSGQFGTRLHGGKDAASPRYIFTKLAPVTRFVFPAADDAVLQYQEEEGMSIEPEHYMPVLPMVLVNGAEGIGTGWSSFVPNYNPIDVIRNVRRVMVGAQQEPMVPYYRGFTGTIEALTTDNGKDGFVVKGVYEVVDDSTLEITELPVRCWTQKYKEFLESLLEGGGAAEKKTSRVTIKHFTENHTDSSIHFTIQMAPAMLARATQMGIAKVFKLDATISVNNMHLYDAEGRIKKYGSPQEIISDFYDQRLDVYARRKEHLVAQLEATQKRLSNQARFVTEIIENKLQVANRVKADILRDLQDRRYDLVDDVVAVPVDDDDAVETLSRGYTYLLSMAIWSLTAEKAAKLRAELERAQDELATLRRRTLVELWKADLDALEEQIAQDERAFEAAREEAQQAAREAQGKAHAKSKAKGKAQGKGKAQAKGKGKGGHKGSAPLAAIVIDGVPDLSSLLPSTEKASTSKRGAPSHADDDDEDRLDAKRSRVASSSESDATTQDSGARVL